jgi:hypothetical protein
MAMELGLGVAAGVGGSHLKDITTPEDTTQKELLYFAQEMCKAIIELREFLVSETVPERFDDKQIIQLAKYGFGSDWVPQKGEHEYIEVWAPVATAVSCITPLGAPFVVTIPVPTLSGSSGLWLPWDFPDGSRFVLDSTAAANNMYIYVRWTLVAAR